MTTSLLTSLHTETDICFAKTPGGELFMVNGIDRGRKWNGAPASTPVVIGLDPPPTAPTVTTSTAGGAETGDYITFYRFGDEDGNFSNLSPVTNVTATADNSFSWSVIPIATGTDSSARITKRQLFRSLVGAFRIVYLVAEIADNTTTTYSDTLTDDALALLEDLPLLQDDDSENANRFGVPPTSKAVCVWNQDRMFYLGDAIYSTGTVTVTNSSATVTGSGTAFSTYFAGRVLYPLGAAKGLLIDSVTNGTTLVLSDSYAGTTLTGVAFEIRPPPGELNTIFFSEPDEPESVPQSQNKFLLQQNQNEDDRIVGGYSVGPTLYIAQQRHTYGFNYTRQPHLDGSASLLFRRGLFNHRCADVGGDVVFCMDQYGAYAVGGSGKQDIGSPVSNYFRDGLIDFSASRRFFVRVNLKTKTVRFYVKLATDSAGVASALVYDYEQDKWSLDSYPWIVGAAVNFPAAGDYCYYVGKEDDRFCKENHLTSVDGISTDVIGVISSVSSNTLNATATIFTDAMVGCPIVFTSGAAKHGRCVVVTKTDSDTVVVDAMPSGVAAGDSFVVGGVQWSFKGGILAYPPNNQTNNDRSAQVVFKPTTLSWPYLDMRHYLNHKTTPENASVDQVEQQDRVAIASGSPDGTVSLYKNKDSQNETVGYAVKRFDGRSANGGSIDRFVSVELRGVAGAERIEVSGLDVIGAK